MEKPTCEDTFLDMASIYEAMEAEAAEATESVEPAGAEVSA